MVVQISALSTLSAWLAPGLIETEETSMDPWIPDMDPWKLFVIKVHDYSNSSLIQVNIQRLANA